MEISGYNRGFADGYRAGLKDGAAGKQLAVPVEDLYSLPAAFLNLSSRALNCLTRQDCETIGDGATLPEKTILRMRGLGKKSAGEIANALFDRGILHTAWDAFL